MSRVVLYDGYVGMGGRKGNKILPMSLMMGAVAKAEGRAAGTDWLLVPEKSG